MIGLFCFTEQFFVCFLSGFLGNSDGAVEEMVNAQQKGSSVKHKRRKGMLETVFLRGRIIVAVCCLICLGACGRVGNIRAPETTAPAPVKLFTAEGKADGILLQWQAPTEDATGGNLKSLEKYLVQRSDYQKGEIPDFSTIAEVLPPESQAELNAETEKGNAKDLKSGQKSEKPKTGAAAFGLPGGNTEKFSAPLRYLDNTVHPGKRYDYRILGVNESGTRGRADVILRVTFAAEGSRVENVAVAIPK